MSKPIFFPAVIAILATGAATAATQDGRYDRPPGVDNSKVAWADVLRVDPLYETYRVDRPEEECYDQPVERRESGNRGAGTVLGAIVGGVLGNTVGKGDGRKAATVAGAVAGGAIGNNVGGRNDRYYNSTETRCRTINNSREERRIAGYDVQYRYRGDVYMSRLDYDPGERMRVRVSVEPAD
ncbi:MAG: glycine zipper 2TM domain-containing protein [Dokdonella sp.]